MNKFYLGMLVLVIDTLAMFGAIICAVIYAWNDDPAAMWSALSFAAVTSLIIRSKPSAL